MTIEGTYHSIIKATCGKLTANIILNRLKLKAFSSNLRTRQGWLLLPLLHDVLLEVLLTSIKQEEEITGAQIGKEEVELSLFEDDMMLYIEHSKTLKFHQKTTRTDK